MPPGGRSTPPGCWPSHPVTSRPSTEQAERFWAGHDLEAVLSRWGWTFHAERLHVVASADVSEHWRQFLDVAGLPSTDPTVVPPYADPAGVAVLRRVNRQLDAPLLAGLGRAADRR